MRILVQYINCFPVYRIWPFLILMAVLFVSSCSTTRNLPEGEVLYRGIKKTEVENKDKSAEGDFALGEAKSAIAYKPNNSLFGSSSVTYWPPIGLWVYNAFHNSNTWFGKTMYKLLGSKPIFISTVNPELRVKVAQNLLHDYGYFNSTVDYEIDTLKNKRKAKISYFIDMNDPYIIDSIMYQGFAPLADSLIRSTWKDRKLEDGQNMSVIHLDGERQRISSLFRNNGYYYFRPDYITYLADTLIRPEKVSVKVIPKPGLPDIAGRQFYVGPTSVFLTGYNGEQPTDSVKYRDITVHYSGKKPGLRPSVIRKRLRFKPGELYSQQKQLQSQENINRLGVFRYSEFQYFPVDTVNVIGTLDVRVNAAFDLPLDGTFEGNFTSKSNDFIGPGAVFSVSKKNVFRGAETFSVRLRGSYEWQTNSPVGGQKVDINSYELGISTSLEVPWIVFPWIHNRSFDYQTNTTFRLYADVLNRARYFRIFSFGGNMTYTFQPSIRSKHSITPFRLTYNLLQTTEQFNSIMEANPALYESLRSQFIPAMSYTYTFDNSRVPSIRNSVWWETSVTSAGNIFSGIYAIAGKGFNEKNKTLFGNPFSQFLKLTSEVRYNIKLNNNNFIATRFMGGIVYSYGNSNTAPYSEQFFIGGANSIRAFTVRTIGPGSYRPEATNKYSYLDQTGDLKFEANVEYRFKILGNLLGATFIDAGNIWLLKKETDRPGGEFRLSGLGKEIALGTGLGLRYDLSFLVVRFDIGVAIHAPYETTKSGYYNIPRFKDGIAYHLAIGYPF